MILGKYTISIYKDTVQIHRLRHFNRHCTTIYTRISRHQFLTDNIFAVRLRTRVRENPKIVGSNSILLLYTRSFSGRAMIYRRLRFHVVRVLFPSQIQIQENVHISILGDYFSSNNSAVIYAKTSQYSIDFCYFFQYNLTYETHSKCYPCSDHHKRISAFDQPNCTPPPV